MESPSKLLRVLLIEDVQSDADLLVRLLTRAGFAVEHRRVDSAEGLRRALDESPWDLILSDHNMPGFDAPAALEIYRAHDLDIPFIVVSGAIGEETAVAMMRAGAHDYLLKSNLGRLLPVVERELRETLARREQRQAGALQARHQQEIEAINRVVTATTVTLDLEQVLDALLDNLRTLSGAERASVMLLDPKTDVLTATAAMGPKGRLPVALRLARGAGAAGHVLESAKPLIIPDVGSFPRFVAANGPRIGPGAPVQPAMSYAGFPLVSRGRIIGVASLTSSTQRDFPPAEMTFLETICAAAAVCIDNALAHQQLRRHAEALTSEIAVHRHYAENVLGSITDGVASLATDKRIASWNRGAETIMGYTAAEAIGRSCSEIFRELGTDGGLLCDTPNCTFDTIRRTGQPCAAREVSSCRRNGQPVALSMSTAPLLDDKGQLQGIVRIFRDFSHERELLDNVQRASRAKSTFLANMSHEIRTPMNAILGFSQILLKDPSLATNHRQHLDVIAKSGEHLLSLIDDILDMSKIDAGRTPLSPSNFNLRGLLTDLTSMFRLRAEAKGLRFTVSVADGVPAVLLADEKKLRQILINLLGNAVKFTDHGEVRCCVTVPRRAGETVWLAIDVEDTGPGVPASEAARIFNAFEQAQPGSGGTGLGLAISREFAHMMGGEITLDSELGKGSRFRLDIPVTVGTMGEPTPVVLRHRVVGIRSGLGPFHVLVVDDQPENRMLLVELLRAVGFRTREAVDGKTALDLAAEWSPHAILMDVRMPGLDGLEAIRRLRATPSLGRIPIIAVSASAFEDDRRLALAAGASDFLGKPFREHVLLEKLRAGLGIEYVYVSRAPHETGDVPAEIGRVRLPGDTARQLRHAAISADYDRIVQLLDALAGTAPETSTALRELVERFDYPGLLERIVLEDEK